MRSWRWAESQTGECSERRRERANGMGSIDLETTLYKWKWNPQAHRVKAEDARLKARVGVCLAVVALENVNKQLPKSPHQNSIGKHYSYS